MQPERAVLAAGAEGPAALSRAGADQIVVAAQIAAVPPAGLDAFRPGEDFHTVLTQRLRLFEQPAGAWAVRRHGWVAGRLAGLPGQFRTMLGAQAQTLHGVIAQPRAQAFAQLSPGQRRLRAILQ